nr:unnamed protein product [Digitaria exilis]
MTMCQQSYGFLPCATTVLGNLFLVITYGLLMYKGGTYLSHGSELLHEILGPGLVGGLLLPVLGALPEALIALESTVVTHERRRHYDERVDKDQPVMTICSRDNNG